MTRFTIWVVEWFDGRKWALYGSHERRKSAEWAMEVHRKASPLTMFRIKSYTRDAPRRTAR